MPLIETMTYSHNLSVRFFLCFALTLYLHLVLAQDNYDPLTLTDSGAKIENTIELKISLGEYQKIINSKGQRMYFKSPETTINGKAIECDELHTRGKTTLYLRRKSFSFDLNKKAKFFHGSKSESMKKFNAVSLSMDRNYIRNRLAFEMMDSLELFKLFYSYSEIIINGETEGIYMIIEKPQDWALKTKDSPLIMRRGFKHQIEKIKTDKKVDKDSIKIYRNIYNSIYRDLRKYDGMELFEALSKSINLEMYMKWLAFNFFVRNGDYTDEVYFYFDPAENRYKVIPWDYDDIFAREPHEGMAIKKDIIGDKLIFSSEDELDQKIAHDPYLYQKYLEQFSDMLNCLTEHVMKTAFEKTYAELYPYYQKEDILEISRNDTFKGASLESLEYELNNVYTQLSLSRLAYLDKLKEY